MGSTPGNRKATFFARAALPILMLVFFLFPFAMRGARVSVNSMRNDVKDWLPASFEETKVFNWYQEHFKGERFVVASWDKCRAEDQSYRLMMEKLKPETPPSRVAAAAGATEPPATDEAARSAGDAGETEALNGHHVNLERDYEFIGDALKLFALPNDFRNWGGRDEKWLRGEKDKWYYLTPEGDLYEWDGGKSPIATALGIAWRKLSGEMVTGHQVASFGTEDGPWYYEVPRRLNAQLFRTVTTGPTVLAGLTSEHGVLRDNEDEAMRRLKGALYGPDGEQTCLLLTLTEAGRNDLHRILGRGLLGKPKGLLCTLAEEAGVTVDELHLGGPTVDNVAIDEEGTITLVRLVSLSVLLGIGLAYACFRSVSTTIMVFVVGGISAVASLALVGWLGFTLDAILMSMPSLVYVLGISGAVHLVNYYREAVEEHGVEGASEAAVAHAWKPALLCNITTAIGLFSLFTSEIVPIRNFGLFSGLAVMATLILLFTYLPAALQIWPQQARTAEQRQRDENPWYEKYMNRFWERFAGGIIRHHYLVAGACIAVIVGVGYGVTHINTSVNLLKLFHAEAKILKDYAWLEENLGKLVPMEIVVKVSDSAKSGPDGERDPDAKPTAEQFSQLTFLERMEIVDRVQRTIEQEFGERGQNVAGQSMSAATFAPQLPQVKGDTLTFARRGATNARLESHRDSFLHSEYLRQDDDLHAELWRISLRIGALQDVDYGEFVKEIKCAVEPVMAAHLYRQKVIAQLVEARDGNAPSKSRVLLVGAPLGAMKNSSKGSSKKSGRSAKKEVVDEANEVAATDGDPSTTAPHKRQGEGIDQTKIFAQTLRDLLITSRLQVSWHDPQAEPLPEKWDERLAAADCVIYVGEDRGYELSRLKEHAKSFVDARGHLYDPATSKTAEAREQSVSAIYTGVVPIVYKAQRTLLNSLIDSTFWSFVTITPLMMLISRSFWAGIVCMLPNALPVLVVFGAMGWCGIQVDIGSMMTASIALGVAVDDTIHYLTWFRRDLDSGSDRHSAILMAYKRCATPTFQAALISGLGLSIFAFSTFTPTQRFGYLMLSILFMGVAAELIFFPALLAGPLGRVFKSHKAKPTEEPTPTTGGASSLASLGSVERIDSSHLADSAGAHVLRRNAPRQP